MHRSTGGSRVVNRESTPLFYLRLLGGPVLEEGGAALQGRPSVQKRRLALFAVLATAPGRALSRSRATSLVWPEKDEERARRLLVQAAYDIRRDLGVDAITSRGDDVVLDTLHVRSDIDDFEGALDRGDFDAAAALYRGPFLDGFVLDASVEFEHWVDAERSRLARLHMKALTSRAEALEAAGDRPGAAEAWARAAGADQLDSRVALRYLLALDAAGNRAGALKFADIHALLLDDELGIGPAPEFLAAVERIRNRSEPVPVAPVLRPAPPAPPPQAGPRADAPAPPSARAEPEADRSGPDRRPDPPAQREQERRPLIPGNARRGAFVVAALMVLVAAAGFIANAIVRGTERDEPAATSGPIVRIAVLPFTPTDSGDSGFADGLSEQILLSLMQVEGVEVPTFSSAAALRGAGARQAASELEVDYVLEGRVYRDGNSLRIPVVLARRDGTTEWGGTYNRTAGQIFTTWDEIALDVLREIAAELGARRLPTQGGGTQSPVAFDLVSRARSAFRERAPGLLAAEQYFMEALAEDSLYAEAHSGLAHVLSLMGAYDYGVAPPDSVFPRALEHARTALDLAPDMGEAHAALANVLFYYRRDWEGAEAAYQQAIRLFPAYPEAHHWYSIFLLARGEEEESSERVRLALELDSISAVTRSSMARHLYFRGDFEGSLQYYRRALERDPGFAIAHAGAGIALLEMGQPDSAIASLQRGLDRMGQPHPASHAIIALAHARAGRPDAARKILAQLEAARAAGHWIAPEYFGLIHMGLGDTERAIDAFEDALESNSSAAPFLGIDPLTRPLRDHPRFRELIERGREPVGQGR